MPAPKGISPPPLKRRRLTEPPDSTTPDPSPVGKSEDGNDAPTRETMRVFSWNINGIAPFLQRPITSFFSPKGNAGKTPCPSGNAGTGVDNAPAPAASLRGFLRRHSWPHILCLQEVKISSSDTGTQAVVRRAVNAPATEGDGGPTYDVHFTLPRDKFNARGWGGKVYGVATIIRRDFAHKWVERVREVDWDLEGRISVVELKGKMAVWNIYAVNGTRNEWRASSTGVVVGTRHDRKLLVHKLLMEECLAMEREGWRHIIIGDLNVAPKRIDGFPNLRTFPEQHIYNRADFHARFLDASGMGFAGVDVWRYLHPDERRYTYHPRGVKWGSSCDRVDLTIVSKVLVEDGRVIDAEIFDSPQERGPSDHVPLVVEVFLE